MEWKIGEIRQIDSEWYQCVNQNGCCNCAFYNTPCHLIDELSCDSLNKKRKEKYIFKKLEKVGESFSCNYYGDNRLIMMQEYNLYNLDDVTNEDKIPMYITDYKHKRIAIEIKQNEDMEDRKQAFKILVEKYVKGDSSYDDFEKAVEELYSDKKDSKPTLKEFDLEAAKEGKPVCTRDGRSARIVCFDRVTNSTNEYTGHLIVLVTNPNGDEQSFYYTEKGNLAGEDEYDNHKWDLMMLPEKKEGWAKVRKDINLYNTKEEADRKMIGNDEYVTAKVF